MEGLLETYGSVQGGWGSKIAKFERWYFLNDPYFTKSITSTKID